MVDLLVESKLNQKMIKSIFAVKVLKTFPMYSEHLLIELQTKMRAAKSKTLTCSLRITVPLGFLIIMHNFPTRPAVRIPIGVDRELFVLNSCKNDVQI